MVNEKIVDIIKDSFELEKNGQFKNAIELLYQGLSIEPDSCEILAQIASLYLKLKNYEIAEEYAQKAIETSGNSGFAKNILLNIYIESENKEKFIQFIKQLDIPEISQDILNSIFEGYIKFNEYEQAINLSEKLENKEMLDAKTLYYVALCNYFVKNYENAKKFALLSQKKNSGAVDTCILLADISYKNGDFQNVYELLTGIEKESMPAHGFYLLGLVYLNNKQYESAETCFSNACEKDNKNKDYFYCQANAYYFMGWLDEALKALIKAKNLAPEDVDILYLNAEVFFWQNKLENSLQLISSILSINSDNIDAKLLKINIYLKKGLFELARTELNVLLSKYPENVGALKLYYQACAELGMKESALTTIEKILVLEPDNVDYLCKFAGLFCELDRWEDAKISLQKVFETSKDYEAAYELAIKINYKLKDYEKAASYAQKWLTISPNSHYAHYVLANIYSLSQDDRAFGEILAALTLNPQEGEYYFFAGQLYENQNKSEEAYQYYFDAFEILKSKKAAIKLLNAAIQKGDDKLVESAYNKVRKIAPYDLDISFMYANYLYEIADVKNAIKTLNALQKGLHDRELKAIVKNKIAEFRVN